MLIPRITAIGVALLGSEAVVLAQAGVEQLSGWGQYGVLGLFAGATIYLFFHVITKTLPGVQAAFNEAILAQRKDFAELTALQLQTYNTLVDRQDRRDEAFKTALTSDLKQLTSEVQEVRLRVRGCPVRQPQEGEKPGAQ